MFRRKEKTRKIDLLTLSDSERAEVIKNIRRKLKKKIRRERSLRHLFEVEKITVKGNVVYDVNDPLKGVRITSQL